MADMVVLGKPIGASALVKLRQGEEAAALATARKNGADDVFVRTSGKDVYVGSGRGFDPKIKPGLHAQIGEIQGEVIHVDQQVNTAKDGLKAGAKIGGIAVAGTLAASSAISVAGLHLLKGGGVFGPVLSALLLMGVLYVGVWAAGGAAVGVAGSAGAGALYGKNRKLDLEAMKAHGKPVPVK